MAKGPGSLVCSPSLLPPPLLVWLAATVEAHGGRLFFNADAMNFTTRANSVDLDNLLAQVRPWRQRWCWPYAANHVMILCEVQVAALRTEFSASTSNLLSQIGSQEVELVRAQTSLLHAQAELSSALGLLGSNAGLVSQQLSAQEANWASNASILTSRLSSMDTALNSTGAALSVTMMYRSGLRGCGAAGLRGWLP